MKLPITLNENINQTNTADQNLQINFNTNNNGLQSLLATSQNLLNKEKMSNLLINTNYPKFDQNQVLHLLSNKVSQISFNHTDSNINSNNNNLNDIKQESKD